MSYNTFHHGPRQGQCKTLTDRVIRYLLEALRAKEINSRSKYRHFVVDGKRNYFVGSAGALRTGKNASSSISITDHAHRVITKWEKDQGYDKSANALDEAKTLLQSLEV